MVSIDKDEFDRFIGSVPLSFSEAVQGKEYVYNHALDEDAGHTLRVLSSIDIRSDRSRADGADAIRTKIVDSEDNTLKTTPHTKRITTWEKNLRKKIKQLYDEYPDNIKECEECGDTLVVRSGKNGLFYGCRSYPDCKNVEDFDASS